MGTGGDRRDELLAVFPGGSGSHFAITSPDTPNYNCIAWAAGEYDRWWWPQPGRYWPPAAPFNDSLDAFVVAFGSLGYQPCDTEALEEGFERVAIFVDDELTVQHMARQPPNGRWTSKLGSFEDVEHDLRAVECNDYGRVARILRRPARTLLYPPGRVSLPPPRIPSTAAPDACGPQPLSVPCEGYGSVVDDLPQPFERWAESGDGLREPFKRYVEGVRGLIEPFERFPRG